MQRNYSLNLFFLLQTVNVPNIVTRMGTGGT